MKKPVVITLSVVGGTLMVAASAALLSASGDPVVLEQLTSETRPSETLGAENRAASSAGHLHTISQADEPLFCKTIGLDCLTLTTEAPSQQR